MLLNVGLTKRVITYVVLVAVLTVVGTIVSLIVFGEDAKEALPETESKPSSTPGRTNSKSKDSGTIKTGHSAGVKVVSITGDATHSSEASEDWKALNVGETLASDNKVKTGDNSKVTFRIGEKSKLELAERGELTVGDVTDDDRRLKLNKGRLSVEYKKEDKRLLIENQDGSAVAETEEGTFSILSTGTTVAVATKTGSVNLMSGEDKVTVNPGEQSVAKGGVVSKPAPIPLSVMLRVVDPGCRVQREKFVVLKGKVTPGSSVTANGTSADVAINGGFSVRVPLRVGKNNIKVVTEDPSGRRAKRNFPCITVDPSASIEKIDIRWGPPTGQEAS